MAYIERTDEEIIAAWERWILRHPQADRVAVSIGSEQYTSREVVEALKAGDELLTRIFVGNLKKYAIENGLDPVEVIDSKTETA